MARCQIEIDSWNPKAVHDGGERHGADGQRTQYEKYLLLSCSVGRSVGLSVCRSVGQVVNNSISK